MDEEQRRREFVSNEANVEHAVNEAAELMRLVLRSIAAKEPTRTLERLAAELRHYADFWRDDVPLERVLPAAVARIRDIGSEIASHGFIIETTFPALGYLAEVTGDDEVQHLRVAKARGEYEASMRGIDAANGARRIIKDLPAKDPISPNSPGRSGRGRASRSSRS